MVSFTAGYPVSVPTQRGIIPIKDMIPGDLVYEYPSGRMISVKNVRQSKTTDLWKIQYPDGRYQVMNITADIFSGQHVVPLIAALESNGTFFSEIKTPQIVFNPGQVKGHLDPDPYITGALLMYGDYDDLFVNLPISANKVYDYLANKYKLEPYKLGKQNKVYFKVQGTINTCLTWRGLFKDKKMFVLTRHLDDPLVPDEYVYASPRDRWQFVRGAFDIGYSYQMFPDSIGVKCGSRQRLVILQNILWSLGVCSRIDDVLPVLTENEFRLEILGHHDNYPGFFYQHGYISHEINNHNRILWKSSPFNMKVVDAIIVGRGFTHNIELQKPNTLYFEDNYLPRVSL